MRAYEYEITRHDKDQIVGRVWWDGKKIQSDNKGLLSLLASSCTGGMSIDDGVEFIKRLPELFKSGYVTAKKVNN
jgi:hypothetical protein